MSNNSNIVVHLNDQPIECVNINMKRARQLKEVCTRIAADSGVSIRESEIVNYLIDKGLPRLVINKNGLAMK